RDMLSPLRAQAPPVVERAALIACVGLLAAAAWLALWLSDSAGFLHLHHHLGHHGTGMAPFLLLFVCSWTVMTVAMMLPTSLPVVVTLYTFAGRRADRALLGALVVAGYLVIWAVFGALVCLGYFLWQGFLASSAWLTER